MKNSGVRMKLKLLCSGLCGPSGRAPEGTEKVLQGNVEGVFRVRHQNRNQVAEDSNKLRPVRPVLRTPTPQSTSRPEKVTFQPETGS